MATTWRDRPLDTITASDIEALNCSVSQVAGCRPEAELAREAVAPSSSVSPPRSAFVGLRFPAEVIMVAVRWYPRYSPSYRDVEELSVERGVEVDHVTAFGRTSKCCGGTTVSARNVLAACRGQGAAASVLFSGRCRASPLAGVVLLVRSASSSAADSARV